jgi:chemotaxis protein MotA
VDVATLVGILIAGTLVVTAILMGGSGAWFVDYPSLMIVFGGTLGATLLSYPLSEVMSVFKIAKNAFFQRSQPTERVIALLVEFAKKARKEGILSFEPMLKHIEDPFLVKGLQLAIDGIDSSAIHEIMNTELEFVEERHKLGAEIFTTMGNFAPALGMLGTIIGLVQMLMQMEDPSQIGGPMAVALLTTFYGVVLANLVFYPIAGKLRTRSKQELALKELTVEGIKAIQAGDNHRIVEHKLNVFLSPKFRTSEEVGKR